MARGGAYRVSAWILREPWAMYVGQQHRISLADRLGGGDRDPIQLPGQEAAYLVACAGSRIHYGPRREPLPQLSVQFAWPNHGILALHALPSSNRFSDADTISEDASIWLAVRGASSDVRLERPDCIARPTPKRDSSEERVGLSWQMQNFIDWQVGCFQELADLQHAPVKGIDGETGSGLIRRDWRAARATWLRTEEVQDDPARMALIVRLARDGPLRAVIEALCVQPRRILQRYRASERLNRVDEIDSACLRWLAKQPGLTAAEKAGPRQRIMAVKRREHFDTLENRVLSWVVRRCGQLGARYLRNNRPHRVGSARCRDVARFDARLSWLLSNTPVGDVPSRLPQPVSRTAVRRAAARTPRPPDRPHVWPRSTCPRSALPAGRPAPACRRRSLP